MNREQLSNAIGHLDESILSECMNTKRRRPWWQAAVSVAACVALLAGMVAAWPFIFEERRIPSMDDSTHHSTTSDDTTDTITNQTTTTTTRLPNENKPSVQPLFAMAVPQYPKMAARPTDYDFDPDGFEVWREQVFAQRQQVNGQADGMTDYYAATMTQFLAGKAGENRVYSPLNVYLGLAMLAETAAGNSRQQILNLLGVSDLTALREKCSALWNGVYMNDGAVTSVLANSLWLAEGDRWRYDADTANILAQHYYASVFQGEMGSDTYNQALQEWTNQQTDNRLTDQVDGLTMDPNTVLALISTINYRAKWVDEFDPQKNEEGVFRTVDGDVPCTYMKQEDMDMAYFGDHFTAAQQGLDDGAYRMIFFLPNKGVSVDRLITDRQVLQVLQQGENSPLAKYMLVNMTIPKFDVVSDQDLAGGLKALGVTDVFDKEKGDFGGILDPQTEEVWVDRAQHAARVSIDEEGVSATAYTAMTLCGSGAPQETLEFTVDRPFMFAITGPGNTILFTGVVENP